MSTILSEEEIEKIILKIKSSITKEPQHIHNGLTRFKNYIFDNTYWAWGQVESLINTLPSYVHPRNIGATESSIPCIETIFRKSSNQGGQEQPKVESNAKRLRN